METIKAIAALIAFLLVFGLVGHIDYTDQLAEHSHQCERIKPC